METFIPNTLNKTYRKMDTSKIKTLGPFAICLRTIIANA